MLGKTWILEKGGDTVIDVEAYLGATRTLFPWGREALWIGVPSHRLDDLVRSCVFSPPAEILEIDAGGSIGSRASHIENWGRLVGDMVAVRSNRTSYRKRHYSPRIGGLDIGDFSIRQLRAQYHTHGVKNPVVHHVYIVRDGIYMLWRYTHFFKHRVAGLDRIQDLAGLYYETNYSMDIYATSQIRLEDEDLEVAVMSAHDLDFLYDYVRPVLMQACGEPSPHRRIQFPEQPVVITEAIPIARWTRRV